MYTFVTLHRRWFKRIRPWHPNREYVMLCTIECRPTPTRATKNSPRWYTQKKHDKMSVCVVWLGQKPASTADMQTFSP